MRDRSGKSGLGTNRSFTLWWALEINRSASSSYTGMKLTKHSAMILYSDWWKHNVRGLTKWAMSLSHTHIYIHAYIHINKHTHLGLTIFFKSNSLSLYIDHTAICPFSQVKSLGVIMDIAHYPLKLKLIISCGLHTSTCEIFTISVTFFQIIILQFLFTH